MNILIQIAACHSLTTITLLFTLGIAVGYRMPLAVSSQERVLLALSLFFTIAFFLCWKKPFSAAIRLLVLIPSSFLLGIVHISAAVQLPAGKEHLYHRVTAKKEATIVGFMRDMPSWNGKTASAVIESSWIRLPEERFFTKTAGKILLRVKGEWPQQILPGDGIIVRADIKRPKSYQTPGAFDYTRYLAEKGVLLTGFIRSPLFIRKTAAPPEKQLTIRMERYRAIIAHALNQQLPPQQAGLYRAILLGDRSGIPPPVLEHFKACGVLHLLAISGLHLTVIWSLFHFIWYWLLSRSEQILLRYPVHILAALLTLPLIVIYALLAGLQPPVLRAAIMSATLVVALIRGQQTTAASLLSGAALLLLLIEPLQLFSPSFLLSFVAVATIFLMLPLLKSVLQQPQNRQQGAYRNNIVAQLWRWIIAATLLSGGISLLTAPITALYFNRLSLVGAFTNLLLEPLLCLWALPCGIFALPLLAAGKSAALLLSFGTTGLKLATGILAKTATLPFAFYWVPTAEPLFLYGTLLFYGGLFLLALSRVKVAEIEDNLMTAFGRKTALAGTGLVLLSLPLFFYTPPQQNRIVFLDVGQGSATLVEFTDGRSILIDGGGASLSQASIGERVIAPYLLGRGKKELDAVILTHPDADHSNGLDHILANFAVKTLWIRALGEQHPLQERLLETARQAGTTIAVPRAGDSLVTKKTGSLSCLYNFGKPQHRSTREKNRGLILLANSNGHRTLFPGDIDKKAERQLLAENISVQSEILLASHHGSKTSNAKEFIEAVNPQVVIVSAGQKENLFPSTALRKYLRQRGTPLLTTAEKGTIEIKFDQQEITIRHYIKEKNNPLLPYHYRKFSASAINSNASASEEAEASSPANRITLQ